MALVTIAVPVYNEAERLARALERLQAQTFSDFEAIIYDNASTDETGSIAQDFAARHARFRYVRQPHNKGALANFHDSLRAATTPYFLWRAADDDADDNFVEEMVRLLEANADRDLAVGAVMSRDLDGANARTTLFPEKDEGAGEGLGAIRKLVMGSHASWIYGLFRTRPLRERMDRVVASYGHPWGFDHLVLFSFLIDGKVIGANHVVFHQIIKRKRSDQKPVARRNGAEMLELRRRFYALALEDARARFKDAPFRALLPLMVWLYTGKRVCRYRRALRRRMAEILLPAR